MAKKYKQFFFIAVLLFTDSLSCLHLYINMTDCPSAVWLLVCGSGQSPPLLCDFVGPLPGFFSSFFSFLFGAILHEIQIVLSFVTCHV